MTETARTPANAATVAQASPQLFAADLPVLDAAAFERTASCLPSGAVAGYMRSLADRSEALLQLLRRSANAVGVPDDRTLAEAAHALAGSAGMFGFARLASTARRFEQVLDEQLPDLPQVKASLLLTTEASAAEMLRRAVPA